MSTSTGKVTQQQIFQGAQRQALASGATQAQALQAGKQALANAKAREAIPSSLTTTQRSAGIQTLRDSTTGTAIPSAPLVTNTPVRSNATVDSRLFQAITNLAQPALIASEPPNQQSLADYYAQQQAQQPAPTPVNVTNDSTSQPAPTIDPNTKLQDVTINLVTNKDNATPTESVTKGLGSSDLLQAVQQVITGQNQTLMIAVAVGIVLALIFLFAKGK